MNSQGKYLMKLADGRNEPIRDLEHAERIVLVDQDSVGAKEITFAYCKFEAKTSYHKKHIHQHAEEVIYIVSGKGIGGVGNEEFEIVAGDTIWVPRGEVHWAYNPFEEPLEMLFLYTRPTLKTAGYEIVE
jgi:quercetin dioxygenase-like cupin family protein